MAMLKSIRILLSITTYFDYGIQQMNVKITSLNVYLHEDINMKQSYGFIAKDQDGMQVV